LAKPRGFLVLQRNIDTCLQETHWRRLLIFALLPLLAALNSCHRGGGSSTTTPTPPSVTISGAVNSVACGIACTVTVRGQVQFSGSASGLSSTAVTWSLTGDATSGTIDAGTGLYTAPATVPAKNIVTITAAAQAQTSVTQTATVTINPSTVVSAVTCLDPVSQLASQVVSSGGSLACTATGPAVFWYINNSATCSSTLGTLNGKVNGAFPFGQITPQGIYKAPQIPPPGGAIAITAVSQLDAKQTFCVTVTVTFGNAALQGPYAFSTSGRVISGNTFFARAGSFTAGGDGTLIGGVEDFNQAGSIKRHFFTGTYSIGPDGRGTMQFCEDISTACTATGASTAFFRIAMFSAQQAQIIEFSSPTTSIAVTAANGEMDLQDTSVFNNGGLSGTFSFNFAGISSSSTAESVVGEFHADGLGAISAGSTTTPAKPGDTPGKMDINSGGEQFLSASSYSISANGRGTATIGSLAFSFYMVSASRAKFIETDPSPASILVGDAFKQQSSASCGWGASDLNSAIVLETSGAGPSGGIADLVSFKTDGVGGVTAGAIDENNGGTVPPPASSLGGTYGIDACGRGTLSISTHSYVFYLISAGNAVIQETTSGVVAHGTLVTLVQPQSGSFSSASFQGNYALILTGTNAPGAAGKEEDFVGQLSANGTGNVTASSLDINNFGATQVGLSSIGTYTSVAANGRTTMLFNSPTRNFVLNFISPTQIFVLGTDSTGTAIGSLYEQF
jgi:hypothetical protein